MRRLFISLFVVPVLLLAFAVPAFAVTTTVQRYTVTYLGVDAGVGDCSTFCIEYIFRAVSFTDNVDNSVCLTINKYDHGLWSTERGCRYPAREPIHRTGRLSTGWATLTVDPTNITLDSGRIVRVSATGTAKGLLAEPGSSTWTHDGCTTRYRWTKWDTDNSPGPNSAISLTINGRTLTELSFFNLGLVKHVNTTTCP